MARKRSEILAFMSSEEPSPQRYEPSWNVPDWFPQISEVKLEKLKDFQQELFRSALH